MAPDLLGPNVRFISTGSIAMMRPAPAMRAPWITAWPTPPQPMTATVEPGLDPRGVERAPTPVVTPQPMSASWSSVTLVLILTIDDWSHVIASANVPRPVMAE